jgi:hypothetical protein
METQQTNLLPLGAMARQARVPSRWLRQLAEAGKIPHLNADGRLLFNAAIVHELLVQLASGERQQEVAHA